MHGRGHTEGWHGIKVPSDLSTLADKELAYYFVEVMERLRGPGMLAEFKRLHAAMEERGLMMESDHSLGVCRE